MLGDKLLTDMLGANRSGILALMVEPRGGAKGAWNKVLHALQRPWKAAAREKIEGEGNFFRAGNPCQTGTYHDRIYEAKFRPVSFTRGNRDVPSSI